MGQQEEQARQSDLVRGGGTSEEEEEEEDEEEQIWAFGNREVDPVSKGEENTQRGDDVQAVIIMCLVMRMTRACVSVNLVFIQMAVTH